MATPHSLGSLEQQLLDCLARGDREALAHLLGETHVADLATLFSDLQADERQSLLDALSDEQVAELLGELDPDDWPATLDLVPDVRAADILEAMPSDEAADLLGELPSDEADALLERMEPEAAGDITDLLRYAEDTAGGLMAKEYVRVTPEQSVADVQRLLRSHQDDAEMIYYLYVQDDDDQLLGVVTLRKLIISAPATTMGDIMAREFFSVPVDLPQEEVAEVVRRHDLLAVPVLDDAGHMLGIITVDDIGDVVQEEAAQELLEMSGNEESETSRVGRGWRSGLLAFGGSILASTLMWVFVHTTAIRFETLYALPVVLLLGITFGSQAAIAMDRAYDQAVERQQLGRIFLRELLSGLILAVIGGILGGLLVLVLTRHPAHLLAIALPMTTSLMASSLIGALGARVNRHFGGWLGNRSHIVIIVLALLSALSVFLWLSAALLPTAWHSRL